MTGDPAIPMALNEAVRVSAPNPWQSMLVPVTSYSGASIHRSIENGGPLGALAGHFGQ